jgi:molecular chaperone GrpE (heat shock protein)
MLDDHIEQPGDLAEWKANLERDFKIWLEELSEIPEAEPTPEEPDLYSFYSELCVLRNEVRKGGRRNQEVLGRFGESLSDFQKTTMDLQNRLKQTDREKEESEFNSLMRLFLPLLDIFERMDRLKERLESPPRRAFINNYGNWINAWNKFKEGFGMVFSHFNRLLEKEGVSRLKTVGILFDPTRMTAVAVEHNADFPLDIVIEEISPGFLYKEKVIKLAEVKISKPVQGNSWLRLKARAWEIWQRFFKSLKK